MAIPRFHSSANRCANYGGNASLAVVCAVVLCQTAVAYTPQMVRWDVLATIVDIEDPLGLFPDMRLGDPVHGMLKYDLSLYANPLYSGSYDADFTNDTWIDVARMTIENTRNGTELRFDKDVDGDFADVDVFNDVPKGEATSDIFYAAQSVVPPTGYQGTAPVVAVYLEGPPTVFPEAPHFPTFSDRPPGQLKLDDWPVAQMLFWDGYFEDPTATTITADIYSLTPVLEPHIPGDFDFDGVVNADDYVGWKYEYGDDVLNYTDGNGDGVTDAADYTVWRDHLGTSLGTGAGASSSTTTAVPEPSTILLALVAAAGVWRRRLASRVPTSR